MLRTETVEPHTFSVLNKLMQMPELQDFALVGGTALSLLYGHRMSVDLDLFSNKSFENADIVHALENTFGSALDNRSSNPRFGIFCFIDEVKLTLFVILIRSSDHNLRLKAYECSLPKILLP